MAAGKRGVSHTQAWEGKITRGRVLATAVPSGRVTLPSLSGRGGRVGGGRGPTLFHLHFCFLQGQDPMRPALFPGHSHSHSPHW